MDSGSVASKEDRRAAPNSVGKRNQSEPSYQGPYLHILTKPALPR